MPIRFHRIRNVALKAAEVPVSIRPAALDYPQDLLTSAHRALAIVRISQGMDFVPFSGSDRFVREETYL